MANSDEILATFQAEMEQVRALVSQQQEFIAQQQASIAAQQASITELQQSIGIGAANASDAPQLDQSTQTSRRGFLGAAALGAAAATAATVAVVGAPTAHAATGGTVVLGQANDANATTQFNVTVGASLPGSLVTAYNPTTSGTALTGQAYNGTGVYGYDPGGNTGVQGNASGPNSFGVWGTSDTGFGLVAQSTSGIDLMVGGTGRLWLVPQTQFGAPTTTNGYNFNAGELICDANADLWLCVATGIYTNGTLTTPAQWAKVDVVRPGLIGGGTSYLSKPIRLLDTRAGQPAFIHPGSPYAPGTHTLQVGGDSYNGVTVPTEVAGAIGNVTIVNPQGSGYLALVPKGAGNTGAAVLAFSAGQIVSNSYNVGLASDAMDILIVGATTDVIVDLFAIVG